MWYEILEQYEKHKEELNHPYGIFRVKWLTPEQNKFIGEEMVKYINKPVEEPDNEEIRE